jgi:hypothetical protein
MTVLELARRVLAELKTTPHKTKASSHSLSSARKAR